MSDSARSVLSLFSNNAQLNSEHHRAWDMVSAWQKDEKAPTQVKNINGNWS